MVSENKDTIALVRIMKVLILIVVEYGLGDFAQKGISVRWFAVLILIVVEYGLGVGNFVFLQRI